MTIPATTMTSSARAQQHGHAPNDPQCIDASDAICYQPRRTPEGELRAIVLAHEVEPGAGGLKVAGRHEVFLPIGEGGWEFEGAFGHITLKPRIRCAEHGLSGFLRDGLWQ